MVESTYNWYWLVDGPAGETLMKQVAAAGEYRFSVCADAFKDSGDMGDFVKNVFLAEIAKPVDSDGDGITDDLDRCPDTPKGVKVDAQGCPFDSDGGGVADYLDKCPNTPNDATVDARQGEPRRRSSEERRVNFAISFYVGMAMVQLRFDTPQLAAGSFI